MNIDNIALAQCVNAIAGLSAALAAITNDALEMKERLDAQFTIIEKLRNDLKSHIRTHNEETA